MLVVCPGLAISLAPDSEEENGSGVCLVGEEYQRTLLRALGRLAVRRRLAGPGASNHQRRETGTHMPVPTSLQSVLACGLISLTDG